MCNPVLIGMGISAAASIRKGNAEKNAQDEAAASLNYQAAVERDNAQAEAQAIRRDGRRNVGTTIASIAASGVKVGQGSAADAERQVLQDTETDASMAILNGERRARGLDTQAVSRRRAGRDARASGYVGAATSLLSRGASMYSYGQ